MQTNVPGVQGRGRGDDDNSIAVEGVEVEFAVTVTVVTVVRGLMVSRATREVEVLVLVVVVMVLPATVGVTVTVMVRVMGLPPCADAVVVADDNVDSVVVAFVTAIIFIEVVVVAEVVVFVSAIIFINVVVVAEVVVSLVVVGVVVKEVLLVVRAALVKLENPVPVGPRFMVVLNAAKGGIEDVGSPVVVEEAPLVVVVEFEPVVMNPGPGSALIEFCPYTTLGPGLGKTTSARSMVLHPLPTLHANMSGSSSNEACRL